MTPDPGFGIYDQWSRNVSIGQLLAPQSGGISPSGNFDLIVHFHGHYPIRKEFVKTANGVVLVAIDLGVSSGPYTATFSSPHTFSKLLDSVEKEMAHRSGKPRARIRKLALSSWSAGYGAVQQILQQPAGKKVDALILLDSVHAGYVDAKAKTLKTEQLTPFIDFARRAARGQKFMFQSHSSIIPPGFASTREVSTYMVGQLGGKLRSSKRSDVLGLKMFERYDRGNYHVRGYHGDDKPDHCAHLGLMKDVIKVHINPRWKSPRGRKGKRQIAKAKQQAQRNGTVHEVVSGDHLTGIAKQYGTTVSAIRDANGLTRGKPIRIGQELIIPKGAAKAKDKPNSNGKSNGGKSNSGPKAGPGEKIHVVASGHSLGRIAKRYHVSVDDIRERNGLTKGGKKIQPGDRLVIPAKKR
jgi:LysM repeat protein